jgi:hypothetical protein
MLTPLHRLLIRGIAAALVLASLPVAAQGSDGRTRFTVRIDPQAAAVVRAWRAAHGLSTADARALAMDAGLAAPAAAFEQHCRQAGGSVASSTPGAAGQAAATASSVCI